MELYPPCGTCGWRIEPRVARQIVEDFVTAVNARAEARILAGEPITGAHHRSLEAELARLRAESTTQVDATQVVLGSKVQESAAAALAYYIDPRADPHESCREGAAALREQLRGADLGKANLRVKLTEATARAERLAGLLREVEWGGTLIDRHLDGKRLLLEACCPSCGQPRSGGHRPDCRIRAALESPAAARATDGAG